MLWFSLSVISPSGKGATYVLDVDCRRRKMKVIGRGVNALIFRQVSPKVGSCYPEDYGLRECEPVAECFSLGSDWPSMPKWKEHHNPTKPSSRAIACLSKLTVESQPWRVDGID